jgi:hypothetical protein
MHAKCHRHLHDRNATRTVRVDALVGVGEGETNTTTYHDQLDTPPRPQLLAVIA